jgi:hypothetical protein
MWFLQRVARAHPAKVCLQLVGAGAKLLVFCAVSYLWPSPCCGMGKLRGPTLGSVVPTRNSSPLGAVLSPIDAHDWALAPTAFCFVGNLAGGFVSQHMPLRSPRLGAASRHRVGAVRMWHSSGLGLRV